jgi:hypothetical protein
MKSNIAFVKKNKNKMNFQMQVIYCFTVYTPVYRMIAEKMDSAAAASSSSSSPPFFLLLVFTLL